MYMPWHCPHAHQLLQPFGQHQPRLDPADIERRSVHPDQRVLCRQPAGFDRRSRRGPPAAHRQRRIVRPRQVLHRREHPLGRAASIQSSALTGTEQYGMIYGTKGYLIAENINDITAVKVYTPDREFVREITMPEQITGFEYEVRASMKAIREGKLECIEMPHEESIRIMEQMDGLRKDWGIEYPFEKGNRPC